MTACHSDDPASAGSLGQLSAQGRGAVLLVEDHALNRELMQEQLETLGFTVDAVDDGDEALERWRVTPYVAVVTDINMPRMNGCALAAALRAQGATLPIFAASAVALVGEKQRCLDAGMTELLLKPLSLSRLDQALSMYVGPATAAMKCPMPSLRCGWMPENMRRLFVESGVRDLHALQDARAKGSTQQLMLHLHAIKGVLQVIGEAEVAELFLALEHHCEAGDAISQDSWDRTMNAMQALLARYAQPM